MEYVVHEQVYNHFVQHGLFHGNHHGFLGNHSTASALIQLYDMWLSASENKELSAALLLDLSAAFDIVDHDIFLKKLKSYNFSENSILWFKSYLEDRIQVVQVETKFSDPEPLEEHAVPQGSILGPLIFLILVQACLRAPLVVADEAKLAIVFTYFFLSFFLFLLLRLLLFTHFGESPVRENLFPPIFWHN